ncbi:MAG: hypothetical protein ABSD57_11735, partial [Verrucomicrobiota bacterium]
QTAIVRVNNFPRNITPRLDIVDGDSLKAVRPRFPGWRPGRLVTRNRECHQQKGEHGLLTTLGRSLSPEPGQITRHQRNSAVGNTFSADFEHGWILSPAPRLTKFSVEN